MRINRIMIFIAMGILAFACLYQAARIKEYNTRTSAILKKTESASTAVKGLVSKHKSLQLDYAISQAELTGLGEAVKKSGATCQKLFSKGEAMLSELEEQENSLLAASRQASDENFSDILKAREESSRLRMEIFRNLQDGCAGNFEILEKFPITIKSKEPSI